MAYGRVKKQSIFDRDLRLMVCYAFFRCSHVRYHVGVSSFNFLLGTDSPIQFVCKAIFHFTYFTYFVF